VCFFFLRVSVEKNPPVSSLSESQGEKIRIYLNNEGEYFFLSGFYGLGLRIEGFGFWVLGLGFLV